MATWPTFSGPDGAPEVEIIGGRTQVFESQAGTKYPVKLWTTARYRFTFRYNGLRTDTLAPAPYNVGGAWGGSGLTEVQCVLYLLGQTQLAGSFGLIDVVNPIDSATYSCRLESDSVKLTKEVGAPWYKAEISFMQV